jgi:hypothetical protein
MSNAMLTRIFNSIWDSAFHWVGPGYMNCSLLQSRKGSTTLILTMPGGRRFKIAVTEI